MHIDPERETLPWIHEVDGNQENRANRENQANGEIGANHGSPDWSDCAREPIHTPSAIQPGSALIAGRLDDLRVLYVSENVAEFLEIAPAEVFRQSMAELLGPSQMATVLAVLQREPYSPSNIVALTVPFGGTRVFDATAHLHNGIFCLELEPVGEGRRRDEMLNDLQMAIGALRNQGTAQGLCDMAAAQIRSLTGYDRVMVYRFNRDGHGEVVSESRAEEMESFLGLHYPASDVPAQARRLYALQRQRAIVTVGYVPVKVLANPEVEAAPMDMTYCASRSVSSSHLEYLRKMGVEASFSISLMDERGLWGLIACHHRTAKRPSAAMRSLADLLGQLVSMLIGIVARYKEYAERLAAQKCFNLLGAALTADSGFVEALGENDNLLDCVGADGVCVRLGGRHRLLGATPEIDRVEALIAALYPRLAKGMLVSDNLGELLPEFAPLFRVASGVLMASIGNDPGDAVLWFRGEVAQTVRWAGDPDGAAEISRETGRLTPRNSFAEWKVIHRGRSLRWKESARSAARTVKRAITAAAQRADGEQAKQSRLDSLTGLPNRRVLLEELAEWQQTHSEDSAALFFLDVDNFKTVNDSLGHAQGDQLLAQVSERLRECAEARHLVARLGGDEFVIFCKHMEVAEATKLGEAIIGRFAEPFQLDGKPFRTTTSVGITAVGSALAGHEDPLRAADSAMYVSKQAGGNQATLYKPLHHDEALRRLQLEQALFQALGNGELSVYYQSQVDLRTRKLTGFEALLRWKHPVYGAIAPLEFIPMAERLGLIPAIGEWVLRTACFEAENWPANINVAVNLSPVQFRKNGLVPTVQAALNASGLRPDRLELDHRVCIPVQLRRHPCGTASTTRHGDWYGLG